MEDQNIGKKPGNYRIVRFIAEGGMSHIYEGKHEKLSRRVAIKVLKPELTIHASTRWRFENEALVMDKLEGCKDVEFEFTTEKGKTTTLQFLMETDV